MINLLFIFLCLVYKMSYLNHRNIKRCPSQFPKAQGIVYKLLLLFVQQSKTLRTFSLQSQKHTKAAALRVNMTVVVDKAIKNIVPVVFSF